MGVCGRGRVGMAKVQRAMETWRWKGKGSRSTEKDLKSGGVQGRIQTGAREQRWSRTDMPGERRCRVVQRQSQNLAIKSAGGGEVVEKEVQSRGV